MSKLVVAAVDGSPDSEAAVAWVAANACGSGKELRVLMCAPERHTAYSSSAPLPLTPASPPGASLTAVAAQQGGRQSIGSCSQACLPLPCCRRWPGSASRRRRCVEAVSG